jgi:hypothetical protein
MLRPEGAVATMTLTLWALKLAVTDSGADIVTVVEELEVLATGPVQSVKV